MQLIRKFPSFDTLIQGAFSAFKRFPLALLSAIVTSLSIVFLIGASADATPHWLEKLAMACGLGVPLFIALVTWAEQKGLDRKLIAGVQALGAVLVLCYYISLPQDPSVNYSYIVRFLLLQVTLHFLVAFLPYLGGNQVAGFWQYNKSLFLRFLNSALFSAVMYIGLTLALIAAKELFGFDIPEKRFFQLFIVIAIIFNTWIFLSGIPQNFRELNNTAQYPNGLRIFVQYILLPLIGLYFVILYAYELKIIITWNWPKGWVSQLVLWFSVSGILSLLLLWPLRNLTENRWIRTFTRWFFRALIPLVVMLFLAISERIGTYGITVNRFLVLAMSIGLTTLVLYFIFGRAKDIRIIPIIVCLIALLSAYGPWSAFSIAKHSQKNRLENYLSKNGLLTNGALSPAKDNIPSADRVEMSQIISYLAEWHGLDSFSPWIPDSAFGSLKKIDNKYQLPESVATAMGFEFTRESYMARGNGEYFSFDKIDSAGMSIVGYDRLFNFSSGETKTFYIGNDTISVWLDGESPNLKFVIKPDSIPGEISFADSIRELLSRSNKNHLDSDRLNYDMVIGNYDIKVNIRNIYGFDFPESTRVRSMDAYILLRRNIN